MLVSADVNDLKISAEKWLQCQKATGINNNIFQLAQEMEFGQKKCLYLNVKN